MNILGASFNFPDPAQRLDFADDLLDSTFNCSRAEPLATSTPNSSLVEPVATSTPYCSLIDDKTLVPMTFSDGGFLLKSGHFIDFDACYPELKFRDLSLNEQEPIEFVATAPRNYDFDYIEFPLVTPKQKKKDETIFWADLTFKSQCARHCNYEIENYCDCLQRKSIHSSLPDLSVIIKRFFK
jgi:hypothetical protein